MREPWSDPPRVSAQDRAHCREMIRHGSKSFHAASLVLPRRVREPAYALYAFCRLADDAVDIDGHAGTVERLSQRLDRVYAGAPVDHPVDRAFSEVVRRFGIPREVPCALIEGLAWDMAERQYRTLDDVHDYSARVAGTVGVMMTLLMGVRDHAALARACDLGVAMQLSNIARDVGEDARAGRLYLPRDWMRDEGIEPDAFLAAPVFTPALGRVVRRLLSEAERLYDRAVPGIAALPRDCRPAIGAARLLYREIGRKVGARGCDSISERAVVTRARKLTLLARAVAQSWWPEFGPAAPALAATQFLVDAVTPGPRPAIADLGGSDRVAWVIDLFVDLPEREKAGAWPS